MNNDLKLNVDKQQDAINNIKDQCDIYDKDEVQEITASKTPMKKIWSVCKTSAEGSKNFHYNIPAPLHSTCWMNTFEGSK